MIPEGTIASLFTDRRGRMMCRIVPVEGGRHLISRNPFNTPFGQKVRYNFKTSTGTGYIDFAPIIISSNGVEPATGRPRGPKRRDLYSKTVLFYDPEEKMEELKDILVESSIEYYEFRTVPEFFDAMRVSHPENSYPATCVVLDSLEVPLRDYAREYIPKRLNDVAKQILGGALVADEIANEFGFHVFVNKPFEGDYDFLRDAPGVYQLPQSLDEQVDAILKIAHVYANPVLRQDVPDRHNRHDKYDRERW